MVLSPSPIKLQLLDRISSVTLHQYRAVVNERFNGGKSKAEGTYVVFKYEQDQTLREEAIPGTRAFEHQLSCTGCSDVNQLT